MPKNERRKRRNNRKEEVHHKFQRSKSSKLKNIAVTVVKTYPLSKSIKLSVFLSELSTLSDQWISGLVVLVELSDKEEEDFLKNLHLLMLKPDDLNPARNLLAVRVNGVRPLSKAS